MRQGFERVTGSLEPDDLWHWQSGREVMQNQATLQQGPRWFLAVLMTVQLQFGKDLTEIPWRESVSSEVHLWPQNILILQREQPAGYMWLPWRGWAVGGTSRKFLCECPTLPDIPRWCNILRAQWIQNELIDDVWNFMSMSQFNCHPERGVGVTCIWANLFIYPKSRLRLHSLIFKDKAPTRHGRIPWSLCSQSI